MYVLPLHVLTPGEYRITYRVQDDSGNWNDGCGQQATVRTVTIIWDMLYVYTTGL